MANVMKIGVIGLGPVGVILASKLKEAGAMVALCESDKIKMNLIRREGIRLEGVIHSSTFFDYTFTAIEELREFEPDAVLLCVKSYHLKNVIDSLKKLERRDIKIIVAMNGIDVEQRLVGPYSDSNILRMVVNFAGNNSAPNVVRVTFFNPPNYVASLDDSQSGFANELAGVLNSVQLDTQTISSFELIRRVWEKNILNSSVSALCAISKMTIMETMAQPDSVELVEQTILEAVDVAEAEKIKFEDDFVRKCMRYLKKAGNHFPSLAVDVLNNRPTEIDYMNGQIVEYGRKHYIRTPLNLLLTNVVRGITHHQATKTMKDGSAALKISTHAHSHVTTHKPVGKCFAGVDIGSTLTKIVVIDEQSTPVFQTTLRTANRDKVAIRQVMEAIRSEFPLEAICATGYGRKHFVDADVVRTEINCAADGVNTLFAGAKNIIDIGGEDIKVIRCDEHGDVENFNMNTKCAAGTGAFLTEIAERVDVPVDDMSGFASKSGFQKELNSFCTVFAKTEVTGWIMDGISVSDICKGVYISIANRVLKLKLDPSLPIYLIGGVAHYHPYLRELLASKLEQEVVVVPAPLFSVALGAARAAQRSITIGHVPESLSLNVLSP